MTCTDEIKAYLQANLSEKRRKHTYGVVETALALAKRYGADEKKAELAALVHDTFKEIGPEKTNEYVRELGLDDHYLNNPNLAHSKIAAAKIPEVFGIDDPDVLNAVSYHTTGRAGMSLLEKIIYLADTIEPSRDFPSVGKLRELAEKDLDEACLFSLDRNIAFVKQKHEYLDQDTVLAEAWFRGGKRMNTNELAFLAAQTLLKKKGVDVTVIDIRDKATFADYIVLASAGNERLLEALADDVCDKLAEQGAVQKGLEGKRQSGWILADFGDVIINILTMEMRERYNIEKVWGDCPRTDVQDAEEEN